MLMGLLRFSLFQDTADIKFQLSGSIRIPEYLPVSLPRRDVVG